MIQVKNLWKTYDDGAVLRGLTLSIPRAKTTIILGRSGAGKSVLLRHLAGLEIPDEGEVLLDGISLFKLPERKRRRYTNQVGMLFQSSALFDSMTLEENVAFSLLHRDKQNHNASIQRLVDEALDSVGLAGYQKKAPAELSGGQKRRAALARLIVYRPKVLLFDEPTAGLDPLTARQIVSLISETQKSLQGTAVVVTHDVVSAVALGDYFAFHSGGTISVAGDKDTFFSCGDPEIHEFLQSAIIPGGPL